jgi:hypothetical protein
MWNPYSADKAAIILETALWPVQQKRIFPEWYEVLPELNDREQERSKGPRSRKSDPTIDL